MALSAKGASMFASNRTCVAELPSLGKAHTRLVLLMAAVFGNCVPSIAQDRSDPVVPKEPTRELVEAWKKAGATPMWKVGAPFGSFEIAYEYLGGAPRKG